MSIWWENEVMNRGLHFLSALFLFVSLSLPAFAGLKNSDCLDCHGDNTLFKTNSAGKAISLFVDAAKLKLSAHGTNACISCHADVTAKHPDDNQAGRAGQLRAVPRAADGKFQRQRPRPRAEGRP